MMKVIKINKWRQQNLANKTVGFVPTMGNLHAGHQSLLQRSKRENDMTVLTIFANTTQFDNKDDLAVYPKTLEQDLNLAEKIGVDYVLTSTYEDLYPDNYNYKVAESRLSNIMEGKHRVGHFDGVLTVVLKLLLLIKPTYAYFGEKDYQQLELVRGMVKVFFIDTKIIACPTIRDENGLALSSRNTRLTPEQYQTATKFPKTLKSKTTIAATKQQLQAEGFEVDYIEDYNGRRFGAVKIGDVRLIDNLTLPKPLPNTQRARAMEGLPWE